MKYRELLLVAAATATACLLAASTVQGQAPYPSKAIKLMVPNPAGGLPDTVARIVGCRLQ
jgi:tripartite-type tricarboxylate transporter receptor subunit TctC